ncbi:DUF3667 domain-containing protein [Draconibacterium sp. IB214405]|uniref:DUF3667 domain-containing protein n=1 Tax=Draconibacterium sp. IB214405 TaxID=3097352 RepID=UPI002A0B1F8C|nr:DUF3667 domain-containing protein [Draconibacterium sp. IB214405]MDX8338491.1 DUF3667 domain-containing protein [Draconibacterium sp. IB214405]
MSDLPKPNQCPNCSSTAIDHYCSNCGQKIYQKRFTLKGFLAVVGNALNMERGFIYTLVWLFRNPGKVIDDYLQGKTKPYINPLNYILVICGVYAFLMLSLNIYDTGVETTSHFIGTDQHTSSPEVMEYQEKFMQIIKSYMNLLPILMLPFASLISKWCFRRKRLYYGEHLILNAYIFAQNILISVILAPFIFIIPALLPAFTLVSLSITLLYFTYAFHSFFKRSVFNAFAGTIAVYVGGLIFLVLFVSLSFMIVILITR